METDTPDEAMHDKPEPQVQQDKMQSEVKTEDADVIMNGDADNSTDQTSEDKPSAADLEMALRLHRELNAPGRRPRTQRGREISESGDEVRRTEDKTENKKKRMRQDGKIAGEARGQSETSGTTASTAATAPTISDAVEDIDKKAEKVKKKGEVIKEEKMKKRGITDIHDLATELSILKAMKKDKILADGKIVADAKQNAFKERFVKVFAQGIPWGHVIDRGSIDSKGKLVDVVCGYFRRDGFECTEHDLDVIAISSQGEVIHFPAEKHRSTEEDVCSHSWRDVMQKATRIYLSSEKLDKCAK